MCRLQPSRKPQTNILFISFLAFRFHFSSRLRSTIFFTPLHRPPRKRTSQTREQELKELLHTNEQLKERWKSEMLTLTDGLQRKLDALRRENCMLKAENNQLRDQLLRAAGPGDPLPPDPTEVVLRTATLPPQLLLPTFGNGGGGGGVVEPIE